MPQAQKKVLLTGIRASGDIHLGNYLGAMKPAIERQAEYDSHFFIADYHALTSSPAPKDLQHAVRSVTAAWLATGLDPKITTVWRQSDVPEVVELSYLLACVTSMGLMERAHSYKDAKAKSKNVRLGVFYYPILMAADILLYDADVVPVGKDQAQHLEMTRDIATFFNETYEVIFKLPQELIDPNLAVIPGTDGRKMSKSYNNGIQIFDPEPQLKKQVMSIVTDSAALEDPKDPKGCNIYLLYQLLASEQEAEKMANNLRTGGYGYGTAKKELLALILDRFNSMRQEYKRWMDSPNDLEAVLQNGSLRAREKARKMIDRIKKAVGL